MTIRLTQPAAVIRLWLTILHTVIHHHHHHHHHHYVITPCPEKKRPRYFQLQLAHSLVDFYNFVPLETGIKILQSHVIYLLKIFMTS